MTYLVGISVKGFKDMHSKLYLFFSPCLGWNRPTVECGLCEICLYAAVAAQSVKALIRLYKRARSVCETGRMRVLTVCVPVYLH